MTMSPNTANPFTSGYRVIFGLILLPVVCAFFALVLAYTGPNQFAIFGYSPVGSGSAQEYAHWCAEMNGPQASPELQAAVDAQRATPNFTQICGH